jgi:hypothetical protein
MEAKMKYLALLLLLCASVARADSIDNFAYDMQWAVVTFSLPATVQVPVVPAGAAWEFPTNINYLGGVLSGSLSFYDPPDPSVAAIRLGYIVSVPPGFIWDPNLSFYQQWPFDYQHTGPLFCCSDSIFTQNGSTLTFILGQHGNLTITAIATPEPGTVVLEIFGMTMIGLVGAALSFGRKERRQANK